jgi:hybrid cluster-associated redox disulfide protein
MISRLEASTIVKDLLESNPYLATVFVRHGMSCVGCDMSKFETLADATSTYGLSLSDFINELTEAMADARNCSPGK